MIRNRSLYVIADGTGRVKVGISRSPLRRLRTFQTGNAQRLTLRKEAPFEGGDPDQVERYAHWLLREHHVAGEWFSVDEETAMAALLAAGIAVIQGLRRSRPSFGGRGRPMLWPDKIIAPLPKGTLKRMEATLQLEEDKTDFLREAVDRELKRRERDKTKKPFSEPT